jgi:hypothetical protein
MANEKFFVSAEEKRSLSLLSNLNFIEGCRYTGIAPSYMRKLCHWKKIPYSRPNNGKIFFSRKELDLWMLRNHLSVIDEVELDKRASTYIATQARI